MLSRGLEKITMNVPKELLARASVIAAKQHRNRSEIVRDALTRYIKEVEGEEFRKVLTEGYMENSELDLKVCKEWEHIAGEGL